MYQGSFSSGMGLFSDMAERVVYTALNLVFSLVSVTLTKLWDSVQNGLVINLLMLAGLVCQSSVSYMSYVPYMSHTHTINLLMLAGLVCQSSVSYMSYVPYMSHTHTINLLMLAGLVCQSSVGECRWQQCRRLDPYGRRAGRYVSSSSSDTHVSSS